MKLKKMKIRNFRSYKNEIEITFDEITALIGKNDIGKSTILEALEIFFNNTTVTCDCDDLSVDADSTDIEISCIFDELPNNIIIDSNITTTLESEYLLNEDGCLEIKKIFAATSAKPKEKVYIICRHPIDIQYNDLLLLKNADLKKRAESLAVDPNSYNATINSSIRNAIWNNKTDMHFGISIILVDKEDTKKIFDNLKKYLPLYALFQSDRPSRDDDKEVTDPMKIAIQQALTEVEADIENIKEHVKRKALETAERTLEKLKEMSPDLANTLIPEFKAEPKFDSLFKLSVRSDDNIPINKRGSGVRRLILLNFFRAEAERRLQETNNSAIIYAFEEPETSQHPDFQVMLMNALIDLSYSPNTQVILTTHTPSLASLVDLQNLRYIFTDDQGHKNIGYGDEETYVNISSSLGVLPALIDKSTKALLLVEGPADVVFVSNTTNKLFDAGYLNSTFENKHFAILPIGGCGNLKHWVTLKLASQFQIPWCILLDSDLGTPEENDNRSKVNLLKERQIKAYVTRKREPENYIHYDCIGQEVEFSDVDDAKKIINEVTRIGKDKVLMEFWPRMSAEQIREVERYEEDGETHYELTEMFEDFLSLVD